jgi:hypothetical protein
LLAQGPEQRHFRLEINFSKRAVDAQLENHGVVLSIARSVGEICKPHSNASVLRRVLTT